MVTSFTLQQPSMLQKNSRISKRRQQVAVTQFNMMVDADKNTFPIAREQVMLTSSMIAATTMLLPFAAYAADEALGIALFIRPVLDVFIYVMNFLFVCRTVMSWYPKTDVKVFPYNAIIWPTEPLLAPAREIVPPAFGVDVSAIVWISLLSFLHEILTGQQGILTLLERS